MGRIAILVVLAFAVLAGGLVAFAYAQPGGDELDSAFGGGDNASNVQHTRSTSSHADSNHDSQRATTTRKPESRTLSGNPGNDEERQSSKPIEFDDLGELKDEIEELEKKKSRKEFERTLEKLLKEAKDEETKRALDELAERISDKGFTHRVPGDFVDLYEAFEASTEDDNIQLEPGEYRINHRFDSMPRLVSTGPVRVIVPSNLDVELEVEGDVTVLESQAANMLLGIPIYHASGDPTQIAETPIELSVDQRLMPLATAWQDQLKVIRPELVLRLTPFSPGATNSVVKRATGHVLTLAPIAADAIEAYRLRAKQPIHLANLGRAAAAIYVNEDAPVGLTSTERVTRSFGGISDVTASAIIRKWGTFTIEPERMTSSWNNAALQTLRFAPDSERQELLRIATGLSSVGNHVSLLTKDAVKQLQRRDRAILLSAPFEFEQKGIRALRLDLPGLGAVASPVEHPATASLYPLQQYIQLIGPVFDDERSNADVLKDFYTYVLSLQAQEHTLEHSLLPLTASEAYFASAVFGVLGDGESDFEAQVESLQPYSELSGDKDRSLRIEIESTMPLAEDLLEGGYREIAPRARLRSSRDRRRDVLDSIQDGKIPGVIYGYLTEDEIERYELAQENGVFQVVVGHFATGYAVHRDRALTQQPLSRLQAIFDPEVLQPPRSFAELGEIGHASSNMIRPYVAAPQRKSNFLDTTILQGKNLREGITRGRAVENFVEDVIADPATIGWGPIISHKGEIRYLAIQDRGTVIPATAEAIAQGAYPLSTPVIYLYRDATGFDDRTDEQRRAVDVGRYLVSREFQRLLIKAWAVPMTPATQALALAQLSRN